MIKQTNKRIYLISLFIVLMVIVVGFVGLLWGRSLLVPRLFVPYVDIGTYMPGQVIERVVRLENEGWGSLIIHEVKGMSLPYGFPKRIHAKSTDVIVLRFRAPDGPIPLERNITLHTNDPKEPVMKVFMRGMPDSPFYASPSKIDLKYIVPGENVEKVVAFLTPDNNHSDFSLVASSPNIKISSARNIPARRIDEKEYQIFLIDVGVNKEIPRGAMQEYILVKTGLAKRPYVVVPVKGIVDRGLRVRPEQVFFGMVKDESIMNRIIRLEVIGPGWDSIKIGPLGFSGISAKLQKKREQKFDLHVSLDPAGMPKILKSYITLEDSSGDTIQIPVLAMQKTL